MPSDIIEYSKSSVASDLERLSTKAYPKEWLSKGEEYFNYMIEEIEDTLSKY